MFTIRELHIHHVLPDPEYCHGVPLFLIFTCLNYKSCTWVSSLTYYSCPAYSLRIREFCLNKFTYFSWQKCESSSKPWFKIFLAEIVSVISHFLDLIRHFFVPYIPFKNIVPELFRFFPFQVLTYNFVKIRATENLVPYQILQITVCKLLAISLIQNKVESSTKNFMNRLSD